MGGIRGHDQGVVRPWPPPTVRLMAESKARLAWCDRDVHAARFPVPRRGMRALQGGDGPWRCRGTLWHMSLVKNTGMAEMKYGASKRRTFSTILHNCVASSSCCLLEIKGSITKCSFISVCRPELAHLHIRVDGARLRIVCAPHPSRPPM